MSVSVGTDRAGVKTGHIISRIETNQIFRIAIHFTICEYVTTKKCIILLYFLSERMTESEGCARHG